MYVVVESIFITLITIIASFLLLFILFLVFYIVLSCTLNSNFHRRCDGSSCLKYYVASDFIDLHSEPISFKSNKGQLLRGYLYHYKDFKDYKALIIFNHGIGSGHLAYTNIIYELCKANYLVLAYDNTGCMLSEGKTMISMIQGLVDLDYALNYVESNPKLNTYKIYCMGHSMGGYISLNSLNLKNHHVQKVVSLAGFDTQTRIASTVGNMRRQKFIEPFIFINELFHYGKYATYSSSKAIKNSSSEVYYIQGTEDKTVKPPYSGIRFQKLAQGKDNIHVELIEGKGHNCYLSKQGETYQISMATKYHIFQSPILEKDVHIDYSLLTELDKELINKIINFLDK